MKIPLINPTIRIFMRGLSIIIWILTIISAFGGRVNPEISVLPAVLCLAMPYFAILSVLLIIYWMWTGRFIFTAIGVLVIILCASPLTQSFPLNTSKKAKPDQETFKIISWNVLHTDDIRENGQPGNRAVEYMINSGADVICLAELNNFSETELKNATPVQIDSLLKIYRYRAGISSSDIKILSRYPVYRSGKSYISDTGHHRFDFFKINFPGGKKLEVAMVHLYSYDLTEKERNVVRDMGSVKGAKSSVNELKGSIRSKLSNAFVQRANNARQLRDAINKIKSDTPLIVCGDFNDVPASWTYNLIKGDDMRDAYIETNFGPTWTYNLHLFYFHIDQMLYRGDIEALNLKVGKINTSDHYPLIGEFAFTTPRSSLKKSVEAKNKKSKSK